MLAPDREPGTVPGSCRRGFRRKTVWEELSLSENGIPVGLTREIETKPDGRYVVYYSFSVATTTEDVAQGEPGPVDASTRGEEATDV